MRLQWRALLNLVHALFGGNPKQFGHRHEPGESLGRDALVLGPVESMSGIANRLQPYFDSIRELAAFALGRSGMHEIPLRLMRARCLLRPLPSPDREASSVAPPATELRPCHGLELGHSPHPSPR